MGKGFLGTDASLMLDVVVTSLVVVVPVLLWSLWLAKFRRNFTLHKWVQVTLSAVLSVVVILFEVDMRLQGGGGCNAERHHTYALLGGEVVRRRL